MAVSKGKKSRGIFSLRGGQVDLAIGVLAYAILESQAAHAEGLSFGGLGRLSDPALAQQVDGLLHQAVATNDIQSMSVEELRALLTPEHLAELGIDAQEFTYLLQSDPEAALAKLEAAFANKLKLASFDAAHKAVVNFAAHEDAGGLGQDGGAGSGGGGGLSPALIIGGVIAAGVGVGFLVGGGGGGSGGQGGQAVNAPPLAVNDAVPATEDVPITFDPRTNDTDANGNALTITQINGTAITATTPVTIANVGVVSLNANGTLTFTPVANFSGTPSFTYTISDGAGGTSTGTVNLTVAAVNDAPVAVNDTVTMAEDGAPVTFDPRTNDTDIDGGARTITQINGVAISTTVPVTIANVGVVSLNADGTLTFAPVANFNGSPSFTYTISDGAGGTATGTVNLTVTAVNDAPVNSVPTVLSGAQNAIIPITGLSVSDVDSSLLTYTLHVGVGQLFAGTVTGGVASIIGAGTDTLVLVGSAAQINATLGAITYQGGAALNGSLTLTVTTTDGFLTDTDSFTLNIAAVNVQAVALSDGYIDGATVFIDVNGNGVPDAGEPLGIPVPGEPGHYLVIGNGEGTLTAFGGTNTDTGLPNNLVLKAPFGSSAVNPLTTVITALIEANPDLTPEAANALLVASLGLPAGTDLLNLDILSSSTDPELQLAAQKAAAQIALTLDAANTAGGDQDALLSKLAALYSMGEPVDLGNPATLSGLFSGIGISADAVAELALTTASSNQAVEEATSLDEIAQVQEEAADPDNNFAPVTTADSATGAENAPFTFNPLGNDVDPEGGPLSITAINGVTLQVGIKVQLIGGLVSLGADGGLLFEPSDNFRGAVPTFTYTATDSAGNSTVGEINLTVTPGDTYITSAAGIGAVADTAQDLADLGYVHIDVGGPGASVDVSLSDIQAGALISAGLDFVADDNVTVEAEGTTTSTSLKGLQDLHVDTVSVQLSSFSIDAGAGGLGGLDAGSLPTFVSAEGGPLDVSLGIASGTLDAEFDLGSLVPALGSAGIDHIDITGSGEFTLSADQALSFIDSGVDFVAGDDITITTDAAGIAAVVGNADGLGGVNIDHIDVTGDSITIDDSQASSLINAGLDFVAGDDVTVETTGTTTSTSLKGLQDLNVDAVNVQLSNFSIDAGEDGLGGLSPAGLPSFTLGQSDASTDISLNIDGGTLDPSIDLGALAPALGAAGIDHIDVTGSGSLTLSADQALSLVNSGVDFVSSDDITLSTSASEVVAVVGSAGALGGVNVDHIDVTGDSLTIDDTQASALINAGIDFVAGDDITVDAQGTHVSTSVAGLQSLHVDTVTSDESIIKLALGSIDETSALPTFDPSKDVIVDFSDDQTAGLTIGDIDHLTDLATSLVGAGIDKVGISQEFDTLSQDQLDTISQLESSTGIDFVYDPSPVPTSDFGTLLSLLEAHPIEPDVPGVIAVSDAATASLIESGALQSFLGETLVVDATDSGDHLLTSLKSFVDLGVDNVLLADQGPAPVYVDLGFVDATPTASELTQLLNTVDPTGDNEPLFSGATNVGLVVDQATLDALAGVDGSLGHLADIGFTEIDVLGGTSIPDALLNDSGIEIKLIGVDDDLYEHLHHDK